MVPVKLTGRWLEVTFEVAVSVGVGSSDGPVLSLLRGSKVTDPSSATVVASSTAVGTSLTSVTVIDTVAVALLGSLTPLGAEERGVGEEGRSRRSPYASDI